MKRAYNNSADSDDGDNLPLIHFSGYRQYNSIKELKKYSIHTCDFCEKMFENRYDYLIHNAKHIIIPLIKMLPHRCTHCGLYCSSSEEMNDHILIKHKDIKPKDLYNEDLKIKLSNSCYYEVEDINEDDEPLIHLMKKDYGVQKKENILQNFVMNCNVDVVKFFPSQLSKSNDRDHRRNIKIETHENNIENHKGELKRSTDLIKKSKSNEPSINNRVEIDIAVEGRNTIRSNLDNLKNPAVNLDPLSGSSDLDGDITLTHEMKNLVTGNFKEYSTIHFYDLIKPGIFNCKRCFKMFPNRYDLFVHEMVHLDLSNAFLKNKMDSKKHSISTIPLTVSTTSGHVQLVETSNGFKEIFNTNMNVKLYCSCGEGFNSKAALTDHEYKCIGKATVNLCDTCLHLRKRPEHVRYLNIVNLEKLEVRVCHWCGKRREGMSLVTIQNRSRQSVADRIRFETDLGDQEAMVPNTFELKRNEEFEMPRMRKKYAARGSKTLSNRERLKLIQSRLKMMKK